jgi:hypothetical protein
MQIVRIWKSQLLALTGDRLILESPGLPAWAFVILGVRAASDFLRVALACEHGAGPAITRGQLVLKSNSRISAAALRRTLIDYPVGGPGRNPADLCFTGIPNAGT